MSTYKQIAGTTVKAYTTNPSDPQEGEMWYNQTTLKLRGVTALGAWSSAAPLSTGRYLGGSFGTPTAGVISTGSTPVPANVTDTEEYNGSGWTSGTAYPTPGYAFAGAGTQTAGLAAGGDYPVSTRVATSNTYNGTSWTATGSLPVASDNLSFCGNTRTGAIGAVGRTPATGNAGTNTSVVYDGSSFSSGPNLNTARMYGASAGSGTGTAGLIWGGFIDPSPNSMTNTEEYDGSSWTNGGSLNTASSFPSGFGTQTDTVCQVNSPNYAGSEQYNGTSWTALPDMGTTSPGGLYGSKAFSPSGSSSGYVTSLSPTSDKTEEWNFSAQVVTAGAWASGGNLNTGRSHASGSGDKNSMVFAGGVGPTPDYAKTEEYDGSTWSNATAMPAGRYYNSGSGTQTAAISLGGRTPPNVSGNDTFEYDGSSWTSGGNYPTSIEQQFGNGTQTASLASGGFSTPSTNYDAANIYNGTSWTATGSLTANNRGSGSCGTTSASLNVGGDTGPTPSIVNRTEEFNGSTWTTGTNFPSVITSAGVAGIQTSAIIFGGKNPSPTANSFTYDGTSYATNPSLGTARYAFAVGTIGNTIGTAIGAGGYLTPGRAANTEEFTAESTSANTVDITTAE